MIIILKKISILLFVITILNGCAILAIKETARVTDIIATDANVEGDTTALYISKILDSMEILITRLARGLPVGGHLEYVDEATLTKSIHERVEVDPSV